MRTVEGEYVLAGTGPRRLECLSPRERMGPERPMAALMALAAVMLFAGPWRIEPHVTRSEVAVPWIFGAFLAAEALQLWRIGRPRGRRGPA